MWLGFVRARYENGVLKPLEKLDFREDEEVIVVLKSFAGFKDEIQKLLLGLRRILLRD
ncbi:MAG: hypothetical protein DRO14_04050 [Thermoprotei archaeon]|nr:MAG: hypothetical protein DRO14_04050 [Thermoprotei archaeon]